MDQQLMDRQIAILCACILLCLTMTLSTALTIGSTVDPYILTEVTGTTDTPYQSGKGRTQVTSIVSGLGTSTAVIVTLGQSVAESSASGSFATVNAAAHNFSIYDGGIYSCVNPVIGSSWSTTLSPNGNSVNCQIADSLITNAVFTRVIMVPIAVGGTLVANWAVGGVLNHRINVTMKRLAAIGLTPTYIMWHQGEGDSSVGTTAANYTTGVQSVATTFRNNGYSGPFFVALETWQSGAANATIRTGQTNAVSAPLHIIQGADWDTLNNTNRQDTTHFNQTGAAAAAALDVTVITNCKNTAC